METVLTPGVSHPTHLADWTMTPSQQVDPFNNEPGATPMAIVSKHTDGLICKTGTGVTRLTMPANTRSRCNNVAAKFTLTFKDVDFDDEWKVKLHGPGGIAAEKYSFKSTMAVKTNVQLTFQATRPELMLFNGEQFDTATAAGVNFVTVHMPNAPNGACVTLDWSALELGESRLLPC